MNVKQIRILHADDTALMRISREGLLSLNLAEMQAIQAYFADVGRDPTDVELETLAQTWSEHCVHKTFRGLIEYSEDGSETVVIDGLLQTTIMRATQTIDKSWCVSTFSDNAGIIEFDDEYNVVFKVETHNHPSAIEPYGGAGTGIGGVIRDSLGTGLGAKPVLNTDVFCLGLPNMDYDALPKGALHPKRVFKGVVAGVRDYGNRMGIPTANGAVLFDERYTANPLVYCGNVGLIPKNRCGKEVIPGDRIVALGGRTGRDGIHGATFSSIELDDTSETLGSVVQIGNPIMEKKIVDALLQARDCGLFRSITDCGAGGFSSAIGEMGQHTGAEVHLENVPLKYAGLEPWEVWLSEAQERMVLAVPSENLDALMQICDAESVEASVLGKFTNSRKLRVLFDGEIVADMDMDFLHGGLPRITKKAVWELPQHPEPNASELAGTDFCSKSSQSEITEMLFKILGSPNVASKEWVIRQYDHEVQGGIVVKPLVGSENDGPGDACITTPVLGSRRGLVVANGINPRYADIDPYHSAASAIDEALRNVIAVGGNLEHTALLDNFSWGNPDKPDRLGGLVRAARACHDIAVAYGTPFISGKDSLYNEYRDTTTGEQLAIPPTLLISAICVMPDVGNAVTMDAKSPGDLVYIVGETYSELGGSHYYAMQGYIGNDVPKVRPKEGKRTMIAISRAIENQLVRACHDCSEGGIGVAAAEMAFAGGMGMQLDLANVPRDASITVDSVLLFSESNSRFVLSIAPENRGAFEAAMEGIAIGLIGTVVETSDFVVKGLRRETIIQTATNQLKEHWMRTFRW